MENKLLSLWFRRTLHVSYCGPSVSGAHVRIALAVANYPGAVCFLVSIKNLKCGEISKLFMHFKVRSRPRLIVHF